MMPAFEDSTIADVAPEEVWKILYDPARFPEWWAGIGTVDAVRHMTDARPVEFTIYPPGYPDFPMAQQLVTDPAQRRVVISCLLSDLQFDWILEPVGTATRISVHVEIPEREAFRLDNQREMISESLIKLAALAAADA